MGWCLPRTSLNPYCFPKVNYHGPEDPVPDPSQQPGSAPSLPPCWLPWNLLVFPPVLLFAPLHQESYSLIPNKPFLLPIGSVVVLTGLVCQHDTSWSHHRERRLPLGNCSMSSSNKVYFSFLHSIPSCSLPLLYFYLVVVVGGFVVVVLVFVCLIFFYNS